VGFFGGRDFYSYVGSTPTGFIDPFGLAECVYSISQHTLTCTSDVNPQVGPRAELTLGPGGLGLLLEGIDLSKGRRRKRYSLPATVVPGENQPADKTQEPS
jgi:hypothetical protein